MDGGPSGPCGPCGPCGRCGRGKSFQVVCEIRGSVRLRERPLPVPQARQTKPRAKRTTSQHTTCYLSPVIFFACPLFCFFLFLSHAAADNSGSRRMAQRAIINPRCAGPLTEGFYNCSAPVNSVRKKIKMKSTDPVFFNLCFLELNGFLFSLKSL